MRKKILIGIMGTIFFTYGFSQGKNNEFQNKEKKKHFSQTELLEIISDIANDTSITDQLRMYHGVPVEIRNKPYVKYLVYEHPVCIQYCPDCIWVVDSFSKEEDDTFSLVNLSAQSPYDIKLTNIVTDEVWCPQDIAAGVFFKIIASHQSDQSFMFPLILKKIIGASIINPHQ